MNELQRGIVIVAGLWVSAIAQLGCRYNADCRVDHRAYRAASPADLTPPREPPRSAAPPLKAEENFPAPGGPPPSEEHLGSFAKGVLPTTAWQQPAPRAPRRFEVPPELPGAEAPPLRLPPFVPDQTIEDRQSLIKSLFPEVPDVGTGLPPSIDPGGTKYTLAQLQQIGVEHSPVLRQAAADVEHARGLAVQAGLCPNPTVGVEQDSVGTADTAGYNGGLISQEFVTAGKLTLAQNAALMDMRAAEHALRRARVDLASGIRGKCFAVLIAQEQLKFNRAIAHLSGEVYRAQIDLVTGGEAAPYEPLQLRVLAVQAQNAVVQAENRSLGNWCELAATLGLPELAPAALAGSVEMDVPRVDYHAASALLTERHTDLAIARARIAKAGYNLCLQQVMPIPNIDVYAAVQHDDTTPLSDVAYNLQVSVPVPLFNRNQGNITAAHAQNIRSRQDLVDARNTLLADLAEVYNRYETNRTIAATYRSDILSDQVRIYRGVYDRFREAGGTVDFAQVVVAQQTLAQVVTSYLQVLSDQWQATVDLAQLLQVDDFFTMDGLSMPVPLAPAAE